MFLVFFPKDDNLGELMSTVCVARVRGWAGVGACSAEGVGDGPDPAGGRLGHHSRSSAFRSGSGRRAMPAYASKTAQWLRVRAARRPGPARRLPPPPSMHPHLPTLARAPHTR